MSSATFACELHTDKWRRRCLVGGGVLAWLAGLLLIVATPLPAIGAVPLAILWSASLAAELAGQRRGMARIYRIRMMQDGSVEAVTRDGCHRPVELLAGSLVLEREAWLRLRFADGVSCGEWLKPRGGESREWRRLRVIWRHGGARFGRRQRS